MRGRIRHHARVRSFRSVYRERIKRLQVIFEKESAYRERINVMFEKEYGFEIVDQVPIVIKDDRTSITEFYVRAIGKPR